MAKNPKEIYEMSEALDEVLASLTPREEKVIKMRFGLGSSRGEHTYKEIAQHFAVTENQIRTIEARALRKLRHPSRFERMRNLFELERLQIEELEGPKSSEIIPVELVDVVETITKLTPSLIAYIKSHKADLDKLPWDVFEHLVAEFFASWGFTDVRLVGRNSSTSADIFAVRKIDPLGTLIKYFVEVKRWKKKVGVNVIDHVYGAMINEKPKFGWHAGMIVSIVGFKEFKKYSREAVVNMGIELKGRDDLLQWLDDYQPNKHGLWLPNPLTLL